MVACPGEDSERMELMVRSESRFLTTHVGSLPRPAKLRDLLVNEEAGEDVDHDELRAEATAAVAAIIAKQRKSGVDVISDGEQPRVSFHAYVAQRMNGFGGVSSRPEPKEFAEFPLYADFSRRSNFAAKAKNFDAPRAIAEVSYEDMSRVNEECEIFETCLRQAEGESADVFMTAASPGIISTVCQNDYYATHEDYVLALAREMKKEYDRIGAAGFTLQIDSPDLAMERAWAFVEQSDDEYLDTVRLHIEAINLAIQDIPSDRVRLHCCWGNYGGPHIHDVELGLILPLLYEANVGAVSVPLGNPRHEHEHRAFRDHPLPESMVLIPGVIDTTTNYVEHPKAVADRIGRIVDSVGDPTRVLPSTDCGFGTMADYVLVTEDVVWEKLRSLRDGAEIASRRFFG
jgi:5-methyltetrahydropteroyltriglutamate--homocysteine methyltransferase